MTRRESALPVALTWLLLVLVSGSLLLRATLTSPSGTAFVGTFYYVDDFYNYLSYVQQAEDGAVVFRNKLAAPALPPALFNAEWLLVGWLSILLSGSPLLAYRLLGFAVLLLFVVVVDRWLVRGGLPPSRRLAGLLLVFTGGGLGGALMTLGWLPGFRGYDLVAGLFPFVQTVANPHFVVGTTLLAAGLLAFATGHPGWGVLIGTVLGLVRPYDAALLAGVEGMVVLVRWPPAQWPRRLVPVAALVPVLAYNAWVFLWSPGFKIFSSPRFATSGPTLFELALAIGPAALAGVLTLRMQTDDELAGRHRLYLILWATLAILMAVAKPVSFSLQFLAGVGAPLLTLGAIGLGNMRRGLLEGAVPVFAVTAMVLIWLQLSPNTYRNVPEDRLGIARALGATCLPGELVLAPPDIGLYVGGLSSCWPFVSHTASPEHASRDEATRRFYDGSAQARGRFLEKACVDHVVVPRAWESGGLPSEAPYRRTLEVDGPGGGLEVYSRTGEPCPSASP